LAESSVRTLVAGWPVRSATAVLGSRKYGESSSVANDSEPRIAASGAPGCHRGIDRSFVQLGALTAAAADADQQHLHAPPFS
jgi:hypothetical protein